MKVIEWECWNICGYGHMANWGHGGAQSLCQWYCPAGWPWKLTPTWSTVTTSVRYPSTPTQKIPFLWYQSRSPWSLETVHKFRGFLNMWQSFYACYWIFLAIFCQSLPLLHKSTDQYNNGYVVCMLFMGWLDDKSEAGEQSALISE